MGQNSKVKRDARKKKEKKQQLRPKAVHQPAISFADVMMGSGVLFDTLDTPSDINQHVIEFCRSISSEAPFFIDSEPEPWSRAGCCDLNVAEYARLNGGRIVCGYRIWYNGSFYIEAERHAIWTDGTSFRDVSFIEDGTVRVLFLPDLLEKQQDLAMNLLKIRKTFDERYEPLVKYHRSMDRPAPTVSAEVAWSISPTYEQFSAF
ncbi:hypothetical protein [Pseudomonas sp. S09G 359]|uniref:hypothetical protein n=1 Tax=Pseudomonas sp. S09G 359 TaxID=2054919 RepID=UPI000C6D7388|nr:hypothetical protein [Pseudomonas sp. S09G 359]AUG08510.1 hypothetical protein CXQ82_18700 [Pseudomonas sp. S09G 359]